MNILLLKAERKLPSEEEYDGYPQIENGVGLMTSMKEEFYDELDFLDDYDLSKKRRLSIATGEAAYEFISALARELEDRLSDTKINVYKIENKFFGENITVAGLVVGCDLLEQLKDKDLGEKLFIPSVMLRYENDLFLDGIGIDDLSRKLGVEIETVNNSGFEFVEALLKE
ncbi:MAG: DUF512 domain-containing protein [Clostridia bacterium]|nr:DUF512 domain-containing protein [Clostridia bacterium]